MMHSGQSSSQPSTNRGGCGDAGAASGFSSSQYASKDSAGDYPPSGSGICSSATSTLLSIVGGAALGGVMMYLLDPEEGPSRRRHVG